MKTTLPKAKTTHDRKWFIVDAEGKTLGRLATAIAKALNGKNSPLFIQHLDIGDYVIVLNAGKIHVTGKKLDDKTYFSHTRRLGHWKNVPLREVLEKTPEKVIERAVYGMIPHNKLAKEKMARLKVFLGSEHTHEAQTPTPLHI